MEFTANPAIGGNGGDWGSILNQILNELKTAANTLDSGKANSVHSHTNLATAQALAALALTVEGKAEAEALTTLANKVTIIENFMSLLSPNLDNVAVNLSIDNTSGGIRIIFNTNPVIQGRYHSIQISKAGEVICAAGSGNNVLVIPVEFFQAPISDGDVLSIIGTIYAGQSSKASQANSFTYHEIASAVMQRITALENMDMGAVLVSNPTARAELAKDVAKISSLRSEVAQEMYNLENPA